MTIEGKSVYDREMVFLMKDLEASGIILIVVDGKRNKGPIEFGSAMSRPHIEMLPHLIQCLLVAANQLALDLQKLKTKG